MADFTARRGQRFVEDFTFKNESGKQISVPFGNYEVVLERGDYAKVYNDIRYSRSKLTWTMEKEEVDKLPFSVMYYTLKKDSVELDRGIVKLI